MSTWVAFQGSPSVHKNVAFSRVETFYTGDKEEGDHISSSSCQRRRMPSGAFKMAYETSSFAQLVYKQSPNMIHSFKQFRKRHLSNGSCGKVSTAEEIAKHILMRKDEDETKIGDDDALLHVGPTMNSGDEYVLSRHPMEPNEIDYPIRCPHPEPCIMQDGRALKERSPSLKRRAGQLPFLKEEEVQSLRWNRRAAPSSSQIYPTATVPETSLQALLR